MASLALGVRFSPSAGGTADFLYSGAVQGYRGATVLTDTKIYRYRAESADLSQWEYGYGAWSAGTSTLARTTVSLSSTGSKINFTLAPQVSIIPFVEDILAFDDAMSLTAAQQKQGRENIGCSVGIPDVIIEDQKASATAGGTSSTGSNTRVLNTLVRNNGTIAALASNQFTLGVGSYFIAFGAPVWRGDQHVATLRNITDGSNAGIGTPEYAPSATDSSQSRSVGSAFVTIAGSKAFSILHQVTTGRATNGLGLAMGAGVVEVYTRVEITKLT